MNIRVFHLTALLLAAVFSFAQENSISNRYIFIEGTADSEDHLEFFMTNFVMEADSSGYIVTESKDAAAHTIRFLVTSNAADIFNQYVIRISLIRNVDDLETISFDFFFTELQEAYAYTRVLFQNATIYIPPITEEELLLARQPDNLWKNKWIYIRASFDYPITFYMVQPTGLFKEAALHDDSDPPRYTPADHIVMAMPGGTLGVEIQILDFMSLEANFQFSMGDPSRNNMFVNMASGVELKFPVKFENIILAPYAASAFFFNPSPVFSIFPPFALGAGIQFSARGGTHGAFFVDIKYMFSIPDAVMHNPWLKYPINQQLFPLPEVIHYKRSYIGIGIGYKFGFFDRNRR